MVGAAEGRASSRFDGGAQVAANEEGLSPMGAGGLAGWVLGMIQQRNGNAAKRHLKVVETLPLGGRRQLLLVSCDGERFLVGAGADHVDTIVRVGPEKIAEDS